MIMLLSDIPNVCLVANGGRYPQLNYWALNVRLV